MKALRPDPQRDALQRSNKTKPQQFVFKNHTYRSVWIMLKVSCYQYNLKYVYYQKYFGNLVCTFTDGTVGALLQSTHMIFCIWVSVSSEIFLFFAISAP